jgi:glycosyltransferase involved in cell wall biosynthesis
LRVAFVSHYAHMRMGGQRSMALLIEHLDRRLVEPIAICPAPGELSDHLHTIGCPVVHVPLHPIKPRTMRAVWRSVRQLRRLLRAEAIDVIAPDSPRDVLVSGLAKLGTETKLVWFLRVTGADRLDPILERLADAYIGESADARLRLSQRARVAAHYETIFGGADVRRFHPPEDRAAVRRALGLPATAAVILFVGQVTHAKGILDIVRALARLRAQGHAPLLIILGTPSPATITQEIEELARTGGVWEALRLLGQREDVARWMQAADLLVSGSCQNTEGLSRVLYEGMACGLVPVATAVHGNREAVTPDVGVLVPPGAPEDLARALGGLLANPAHRAALGARAAVRAHERFDIARHARNVEAFLFRHCRPPADAAILAAAGSMSATGLQTPAVAVADRPEKRP